MKLNTLEKILVIEFLSIKGKKVASDECSLFSNALVQSRDFSGVGFISNFDHSRVFEVEETSNTYKWGSLGARLNSTIDSGYLFYVEKGYLTSVEGYTYNDAWPNSIDSIELYKIDSS